MGMGRGLPIPSPFSASEEGTRTPPQLHRESIMRGPDQTIAVEAP